MNDVDEAEWARAYRALEKPLYNVVYRWLWDAAESQDVVQDAFLRCWRKRDEIGADGFRAFVFRTALNLASNQRRRRRLWQLVPLSATRLSRGDAATEPDFVSRPLKEAVDELPEPLKRVLLLSEIAGMTYREIALVMDIREGTVGSRRNRAIAMLRERLEAAGVTFDEC